MRCGQEEGDSSTRGKDNRLKLLDDEYAIVHCTGYIKVRQFPHHGSLRVSVVKSSELQVKITTYFMNSVGYFAGLL